MPLHLLTSLTGHGGGGKNPGMVCTPPDTPYGARTPYGAWMSCHAHVSGYLCSSAAFCVYLDPLLCMHSWLLSRFHSLFNSSPCSIACGLHRLCV
ncbi:hypothetical protein DUNSADRAFT_8241 [Dunaliella salina]|uniref:Encoded protein n=1 Tax=Dunaliella salina TaxID=3046 RepID=A0ABQ7HA50_DUNSA|nr:hypothetical protein DUNSADRAFT_8241 [Dunaliella salina]|eukprot:KAF5843726.1 hypothetical protein DUNSADRAFT_8241 [Dunaliella salina]